MGWNDTVPSLRRSFLRLLRLEDAGKLEIERDQACAARGADPTTGNDKQAVIVPRACQRIIDQAVDGVRLRGCIAQPKRLRVTRLSIRIKSAGENGSSCRIDDPVRWRLS